MMKGNIEALCAALCFLFTVSIIIPAPLMASDITIVGMVNDSNQIVANELIFEVDDTPEGEQLVKEYIGKKVKVIGKLNIEGDMRIISVQEFEVIKN